MRKSCSGGTFCVKKIKKVPPKFLSSYLENMRKEKVSSNSRFLEVQFAFLLFWIRRRMYKYSGNIVLPKKVVPIGEKIIKRCHFC